MVSLHEPTYDEIRNLALKLYTASKKKRGTQQSRLSDEELKLSGYWTKARLILQGKRVVPKRVRELIIGGFKDYTCPNCGKKLPSSNLIMKCENCHRIGCFNCIGIQTFVNDGKDWKLYVTLRGKIKLKTLRNLPKKKVCVNCLYILDEINIKIYFLL